MSPDESPRLLKSPPRDTPPDAYTRLAVYSLQGSAHHGYADLRLPSWYVSEVTQDVVALVPGARWHVVEAFGGTTRILFYHIPERQPA